MEAKDEDSVDLRVRRRLRDLRMQRGLTLEEVAGRASIDVSTLSRLESGKRRLALDHLPRLAAALSVSTDELLRAPEADDPRVRGSSHTRDGITYWPLTQQAGRWTARVQDPHQCPAPNTTRRSYPCTKDRSGCTCCPVSCD